MNETEKKRYDEIQRSVNPKTKIRKVKKDYHGIKQQQQKEHQDIKI